VIERSDDGRIAKIAESEKPKAFDGTKRDSDVSSVLLNGLCGWSSYRPTTREAGRIAKTLVQIAICYYSFATP